MRIALTAAVAAVLALVPAAAGYKNPTPGRALVVQIPGMHRVKVVHRARLDVYRPRSAKGRLPAVLLGGRKGSARAIGWSQLIAASRMAAVSSRDLGAAIAYVRRHAASLGIDASRLCTLSFGAAPQLEAEPWLRCGVVYYGAPTGDPTAMPPTLVVKAGRDRRVVNDSIDRFATAAQDVHADVRVLTNATAGNGFDIADPTKRSRAIVAETLRYLRARLAAPVRLTDGCVSKAERASTLRFFRGDIPLAGVELGSGPAGVVLVHGYNGDLCSWLPYGQRLAASGYHVLAFDTAPGVRYDLDAEAAVEALRRVGAKRVAIAGSSLGALAAIIAGSTLPESPDAVVSLSAISSFGPLHGIPAAGRLTAPVLFAASDGDGSYADDARTLYDAATSAPAREIHIVPGVQHGDRMLADPGLWSAFTSFLAAHLR